MAVVAGVRRRAAALALGALLAACEADSPPVAPGDGSVPLERSSAVGFDPGPIRTAEEYLAEPQFMDADMGRGELLSLACAACHWLDAEQGTLIGPHLEGVFGRRAGSVEGFEYSPALRASGLVWTPRALEAWLSNPAGFVEGTTMAFTGYRSPGDRRDLIAYLLRATQ